MNFSAKIMILLGFCLVNASNATACAQDAGTEFRLAAGYYERGQWVEAIAAFQRVTRQFPNTPAAVKAQFYWAETDMQRLEFDDAFVRYRAFLKVYPSHRLAAQAMFRMGESALRSGKTDVALRMLEEFSRTYTADDLNRFALPYLGQLRVGRHESQLAARAFETALQRYPQGPLVANCHFGLGKAMLKLGEIEFAQRKFEFCLDRYADLDDIAGGAKIQLGHVALASEPSDENLAEQWFQTAIADASNAQDRSRAILPLAKLWNQNGQYFKCLDLLRPVLDFELTSKLKSNLLLEAAFASAATDNVDQALAWLEQIRIAAPNDTLLRTAVRFELKLLQSQANSQQAIELADAYHLIPEKRALILNTQETLGRQQYNDRQFQKSLATFDGLLALDGFDQNQRNVWHCFRALNLIGINRYADAEDALAQISLDSVDDSMQALTNFCFASIKFRQDNFVDAIPYYQQYLAQSIANQDHAAARAEFIICLAKTDRFAEIDDQLSRWLNEQGAEKDIEHVVEIVADQANARDHSTTNHWYQWLITNGQDDQRRARATAQLAMMKLEVPLDQQRLSLFSELFTISPGDKKVTAAAIKRASHFESAGEFGSAIQLYLLIADQPQPLSSVVEDAVRLKLARLYQMRGSNQDLVAAETQLQTWLNESADRLPMLAGEVVYQLAWVQHDNGKRAESNSSFKRIVQNYENSKYWPDAAYRVAQTMAKQKAFDQAQQLLTRIVSRSDVPAQIAVRSHFMLGKIALARQNWSQVATSMTQTIQLTSDESVIRSANYFLAESRFQLNDPKTALADFEQLHSDLSKLKPSYRPWVELRLATLLLDQQQFNRAMEISSLAKTKYIDFESRHEFNFLIGRCMESRGLLDDARDAFAEVVNASNAQTSELAAHAQWRIGETYFHQENYRDAIAAYYKVDSLHTFAKWRAAALLQAGKCQEHLANPANAVKLYRLLLKRYPSSHLVTETRERLENLGQSDAVTAQKTLDNSLEIESSKR